MSIGQALIILCVFGHFGVKANLNVYVEDISVERLDPEYFDVDKTELYIVESSTNENTITANVTLIKTLSDTATGRFKLLGLSRGKYNIPTGIDVFMDFCEMIAEPIVLGPFFAVLGFSPDACPPEPAVYFQEGYIPPVENFPDDFPENKYSAIFEISEGKKITALVIVYIEIQI